MRLQVQRIGNHGKAARMRDADRVASADILAEKHVAEGAKKEGVREVDVAVGSVERVGAGVIHGLSFHLKPVMVMPWMM